MIKFNVQVNMEQVKGFDLEDRLIKYAGNTINFTSTLKYSYAVDVLRKQLVRSSSSAALNYGEAQGAESRRDFVHKNKIVIKELKECRRNFKLMRYLNLSVSGNLPTLIDETEQLIAIFSAIVRNTRLEN